MITPMVKYSFLAFHQDYRQFLEKLQELGMLDIEKERIDLGETEKKLFDSIGNYKQAIRFLSTRKKEKKLELHAENNSLKASEILSEFDHLNQELPIYQNELKKRQKEYDDIKMLGDYDVELLKKLESQGISLSIYKTDSKRFKSILKSYNELNIEVVHDDGKQVCFALITRGNKKPEIEANEVKIPLESPAALRTIIAELEEKIENVQQIFDKLTAYIDSLQSKVDELQEHFDFEKALTDTQLEANEKVCVLTGYIPVDKEPELKKMLENEEVYYVSELMKNTTEAPVLLKNSKFSKLFEVITKVFSLPAYNELDLTAFFAPFFMIFFGFCLGDGGYGLLFILLATIFKRKLQPEMRPIASLVQWLGLATIFFGLLTGTFFGMNVVEIPALSKFKSYVLSQDNLMALSFALGGIQTLLAMVLNVVNISRKSGFKYAIGHLGWIFILLGAAAVIGLPMLGLVLSPAIEYLCYAVLILGFAAAFLYNKPGKNVFLNFGSGLWNAYNMVTGLLGDLLSYVRLFALGLTGGILGSVFNTLAVDMSGSIPVVSQVIMILILVIGHGLNIALSALGAMVHPLRLTFVEFYKNAGFEGNGKAYKPFKKRTVKN